MNATRLLFACMLPLALGACGVPDIIAHGVKEFDRSQNQAEPAASTQSAPAQAPASPVMHQEPPPAAAPAPVVPRDSVTVETLPPPQ